MENVKSYYSGLEIYTDLLDMVFKFYPEGIVCKDSDLRYINVNDAYCKFFSLDSPNDILYRNNNNFLPDNVIKLIYDADNEIKKNHYSLNYILNINNEKILSVTSSPILQNNIFLGIISCVKDITQEEILKENFVDKHFKYLTREKILQTQRETFVASISHDLKNPTIAQIRGLELILKGSFGNLNAEQSEILKMILDSCRYMNGMLSSLLTTYRNYGGAIKLNFTEFSLLELVKECVSEMIYVAKDKALNILTNSNAQDIICADRVQIKRVIMNLLSNAIKYAYNNTDLKLSLLNDSENTYFELENQSPYLPKDKQKSIFARYVSYAGIHKELGNGLGLYASKKIIESHCGEIYVKSFEEGKNIFGFKIPVKQNSDRVKEVIL